MLIKDFISEPIMDVQNECDDGGASTYIHIGKLDSNSTCYQN